MFNHTTDPFHLTSLLTKAPPPGTVPGHYQNQLSSLLLSSSTMSPPKRPAVLLLNHQIILQPIFLSLFFLPHALARSPRSVNGAAQAFLRENWWLTVFVACASLFIFLLCCFWISDVGALGCFCLHIGQRYSDVDFDFDVEMGAPPMTNAQVRRRRERRARRRRRNKTTGSERPAQNDRLRTTGSERPAQNDRLRTTGSEQLATRFSPPPLSNTHFACTEANERAVF